MAPLPRPAYRNYNMAQQDYQMQLVLLEQQNKKRLLMARCENDQVDDDTVADPNLTPEQAAERTQLEQGPMRVELKHLDKKLTSMGQAYYAETVEEEADVKPEQINWWSQFALCLVRHMKDQNNVEVQSVWLQINSSHLKEILKDTIKEYPGVSFATKYVSIEKPYHCLFHYRHEIEAAGARFEKGSEARRHHDVFMQFINDEFRDAIRETENLLEQGLISYEYLWTIFAPGQTVYSSVDGQARAFTLQDYSSSTHSLILNTQFVDFDGERQGLRHHSLHVSDFSGSRKINSLSVYPIQWHSDPYAIQQSLIARGRRWEALAGVHFMNYTGIAEDFLKRASFHYEGKVVVDTKTSHRLNPEDAFRVDRFTRSERRSRDFALDEDYSEYDDDDGGDDEYLMMDDDIYFGQNHGSKSKQNKRPVETKPLTDKQCLTASDMVRGFAFGEKRWLEFFVDQLTPIEWDTNCFDQLVLPPTQKNLIKALVATRIEQRANHDDDIVEGKGKGLIFVLHGPPGTGKTLTAETVAEFSQRPLYNVSSAELGTNAAELDEKLSRILDMASTWNAVLLIDEADVFLEARSLHDLHRNALVSIFLRVLEYYHGILFLTSNRIATFDEAFKSRIHVPLKYHDLTPAARKQIWKNFLARSSSAVPAEGEKAWADAPTVVDEKCIERLARADLNGRQIKNIIRTARSLALFHGQPLDEQKLRQVIGIHEEFEHELDQETVVRVVDQKVG